MREPAIMRWPNKIKAGQNCQALATTMDLYATALSLGGATISEDRVLDGMDLSPLLIGQSDEVRNEIIYYPGHELFAYRNGDWKIHYKATP